MGKTYLDIVKYVIYANVEISGNVEKSDVIGAIFGQTEGLLGEELDIRELQRNGKVGRIEINLTPKDHKSVGRIIIPSSLDMVETSILGAAIEVVDRVGPFEARIKTEKIEDVRNEKRKKILERSKQLLKYILTTQIPDAKELTEKIREEVKISEAIEYGPEKLAAGPDIDNSDEIIIVEGKADVLNLLRNGITNCIAVGGATIPQTIIDLSRKKEVTLFVDGDRGGDIIVKELIKLADIDYIAKAPAGKEVEELTKKEIVKSLRSKVPVIDNKHVDIDALAQKAEKEGEDEEEGFDLEKLNRESKEESEENDYGNEADEKSGGEEEKEEPIKKIEEVPASQIREQKQAKKEPVLYGMVMDTLSNSLNELKNTLRARFYDAGGNIIKEMPIRELLNMLNEYSPYAIVLDGVVTQRLVDEASKRGVEVIFAQRKGNIFRIPQKLTIYTPDANESSKQ